MHAIFLTTFWEVLAWITIASLLVLTLAMFAWLFLDIFRRRDLSGLGKAAWACLIFVLPLLGAFIYLIARPRSASFEQEGIVDWAPQPGKRMSPAEEVSYAKQLLDQGTITRKEFEEVKWNATH